MKLLNTKKELCSFEHLGVFDEAEMAPDAQDLMEMKRQIESWSYVVSPPLFIWGFSVREEDR